MVHGYRALGGPSTRERCASRKPIVYWDSRHGRIEELIHVVGRAQDVRIGTELPSADSRENLRPAATPPSKEPPTGLKRWLANYTAGVDTWSRALVERNISNAERSVKRRCSTRSGQLAGSAS
jgi:hypothetical protein